MAGIQFDSQPQTIAKRKVGAGAADVHGRALVEVAPARGLDSEERIDVQAAWTCVRVAYVAVDVHLCPGLQEIVCARGEFQRGCISIRGAKRANLARSLHLRRQCGDCRQRLRDLDGHVAHTRAAAHCAMTRAICGGYGKGAVVPCNPEQVAIVRGKRRAA